MTSLGNMSYICLLKTHHTLIATFCTSLAFGMSELGGYATRPVFGTDMRYTIGRVLPGVEAKVRYTLDTYESWNYIWTFQLLISHVGCIS